MRDRSHQLYDRRGFITACGAMTATACTPLSRPAARFTAVGGEPLGVQLYTVDAEAKADLDGTLNALSAIGYSTVELAGYLRRTPAELRYALDRAGLRCTSAHVSRMSTQNSPGLDDDPAFLAAHAKILGFDTVIMPMFNVPAHLPLRPLPGEDFAAMATRIAQAITAAEWRANCDYMNVKGAALRRHGLRFGYHNHNVEFGPLGSGTILDMFLRDTDPELVDFELDVGWAASAGVDAAQLLRAHPGRFTALHIKDIKATTKPNFVLQQNPAEVGQGVVDWRGLMAAARQTGIKRFFVEQEAPFATSPLQSLRTSFDYLATLRA